MYKESRLYYSDTLFERRKMLVRREDRACCNFHSPAPFEIKEGVGVILSV